jgi:hypothetical protein
VAGTPAEGASFADTVIAQLEARDWKVEAINIGQPLRHSIKHNYIDLGFKGDPSYLFPSFNLDNNEYLVIAMENTGIRLGRNGFEKDKSPEKTPDSPEDPDEFKTHVTDAWDTLYIGMNFHYPSHAPLGLTTHFPIN